MPASVFIPNANHEEIAMAKAARITAADINHAAAHAAQVDAARTGADAPAPAPAPAAPAAALTLEQALARIALLEDANRMLRERLTKVRTDAAAEVDRLERIAKVGPYAPQPKAPRPARVPSQDELDRKAAMDAAKAAAMAPGYTGTVLVRFN